MKKDCPATWEEAMRQFLWWEQAQGLREITLKGQRDVIRLFFNRHPTAWQAKLKESAYEFLAEKIKPATYNIRINYLRKFFGWAVSEGIVSQNPLEGFKRRRDEGRTFSLDEETLAKLLSLPDRKTYAGQRDFALLCLSLDTGIRPKEAFSLTLDDVSFRALEVRVSAGVAKTGVSRTLPICPVTARTIRELVLSRHPAWDESVSVFCTTDGTPLRNDTWGDRLAAYSKRLGVKFHPYALRHSFATCFLRQGGNALALQRI
jgi:site-specific recombinase XerD